MNGPVTVTVEFIPPPARLSSRRSFSPFDIVGYVDDETPPAELLGFFFYVAKYCPEDP